MAAIDIEKEFKHYLEIFTLTRNWERFWQRYLFRNCSTINF